MRTQRTVKKRKALPVAYLWDLTFYVLRNPGEAFVIVTSQGSTITTNFPNYKTYKKAREAIRRTIKALKTSA